MLRSMLAVPLALVLAGAAGAQSQTLVVANQGAGTVSVVDLATGRSAPAVPVPAAPHEVAIALDGARAAISDYGDRAGAGHALTLVDLRGGAAPVSVDLSPHARPHGVAWIDAHRLAVTSESSQALLVVNADTKHVDAAIPTHGRGSHMVVLAPDRTRAYVVNVGDGTLSTLNLRDATFVASVRTGGGAEGVGISPDGREVWVANRTDETVAVVDTATNAVVATIPAPGLPYRVAFAPGGATAYVSCVLADRLRAFDVRSRRELAPVELPRPTGLFIARDGRTAYVAHGDGAEIRVVDLAARRVTRSIAVGATPDGVAVAEVPTAS